MNTLLLSNRTTQCLAAPRLASPRAVPRSRVQPLAAPRRGQDDTVGRTLDAARVVLRHDSRSADGRYSLGRMTRPVKAANRTPAAYETVDVIVDLRTGRVMGELAARLGCEASDREPGDLRVNWTPRGLDGRHLAVIETRTANGQHSLWLIEAVDGGGLRQIDLHPTVDGVLRRLLARRVSARAGLCVSLDYTYYQPCRALPVPEETIGFSDAMVLRLQFCAREPQGSAAPVVGTLTLEFSFHDGQLAVVVTDVRRMAKR